MSSQKSISKKVFEKLSPIIPFMAQKFSAHVLPPSTIMESFFHLETFHYYGVTSLFSKKYSLRPIKDDSLSFLVCPNQDDPLPKIETPLSLLYSLSLTLLSPLNTQNKVA